VEKAEYPEVDQESDGIDRGIGEQTVQNRITASVMPSPSLVEHERDRHRKENCEWRCDWDFETALAVKEIEQYLVDGQANSADDQELLKALSQGPDPDRGLWPAFSR
jgi:hypothetical protein